MVFQNLTGILVGFSTGKCQLMTNRGKVIISQQWLPEPVQSIQLPNGKKTIDEIYVLYQSSVCILQTKQLMQSIRNYEKLGENRRKCVQFDGHFGGLRQAWEDLGGM